MMKGNSPLIQGGRRSVHPFRPASCPVLKTRVSLRTQQQATSSAAERSVPAGANGSHAAVYQPPFKAHLDYRFMKDNVDLLISNTRARNSNADPALVVQLYEEFTLLKQEADNLRAKRNENSGAVKVW